MEEAAAHNGSAAGPGAGTGTGGSPAARPPATPEGMALAYGSLVLMALLPIFFGALRSVSCAKSKNSSEMPETITSRDAARFPIVASCTLLGLYLFFKIFSQEYINLLLSMYFFVLGILALSHTISPMMNRFFPANFPNKQYQLLFTQGSGESKEEIVNYEFDTKDLVCLALSSVVGVWYLLRKHWIANNLFGLAFSLNGVELLHLNNVSTGCILLGGLFIYDVFWVNGSVPRGGRELQPLAEATCATFRLFGGSAPAGHAFAVRLPTFSARRGVVGTMTESKQWGNVAQQTRFPLSSGSESPGLAGIASGPVWGTRGCAAYPVLVTCTRFSQCLTELLCRMRLLRATLILLVWAVPRLCHLLAPLASFCSLAQRAKHWNASSPSPSARAAPQHLHLEVFLISLQWDWRRASPCNGRIPQSFLLPPPSEILCFQMSDSPRTPGGLSSSAAAARVILPYLSLVTVVLFCTWLVLPLFQRLLNSLSSAVP